MIDKLSKSLPIISSKAVDTKNKVGQEVIQDNQQEDLVSSGYLKEDIENVVNSMNQFLQVSNTHLKFEFHEELQEYYVAIVDNVTQEVIKEIPPKKMLDIYASMTEFLGLLVDKKI
ncbi:flagellar protein FlaG [Bacillus sp. JJ722]|uniref:flagellar protein FlaG n=1 Tax=Bacillus sp. JJ722 TaxID=3122973 RepID=UPI002FFF89AB